MRGESDGKDLIRFHQERQTDEIIFSTLSDSYLSLTLTPVSQILFTITSVSLSTGVLESRSTSNDTFNSKICF